MSGKHRYEGFEHGSSELGTCRGVGCASVATSAMVRPHSLRAPTATTSIRPLPSVTCTPHAAPIHHLQAM